VNRRSWHIWIPAVLLAVSAAVYALHYAVFHDARHIFIYLLGDLAFLPLSVLLVTLVIDSLLSERDRRAAMEKQNMVIGAFFSEVGTRLLGELNALDPEREDKQRVLRAVRRLAESDYRKLEAEAAGLGFRVDPDAPSLEGLKATLIARRDFLVRLLENPLLLEHETFSDVLWAVFHLAEELESRRRFTALPATDMAHLAGDCERAYRRLTGQWLSYMRHLSAAYPYLYSLALRQNPFDPEASVLVTDREPDGRDQGGVYV